MLDIVIPESERFDESTCEFIYTKEQKLKLEHSLISLSKWESKWEKPFLSSEKTPMEILDYIKCMTITQNVDPSAYLHLSKENIDAVQKYIEAPMSAQKSYPKREGQAPSREIITSEIIYYWMISFNIPFECERWHLNKLLKLIEVCSHKSETPKKMSKNEVLRRNRELNAARRAKYHTKG